jgi:hypothetical protein
MAAIDGFWNLIATTPIGVVVFLVGLLLCIIAIFGRVNSRWVEFGLSFRQRIIMLIFGIGLIILALFPWLRSKSELPIGTVIIWWGNLEQKPSGFELCDGKPPKSTTAKLKGNKPDLTSRFPRGTADKVSDVRDRPNAGLGGLDETPLYQNKTGDTTLTISQLPSHNHGGVTALSGNHSHDTFLTNKQGGGAFGRGSRQEGAPQTSEINSNTVFRTSSEGQHSHPITADGEGKPHNHELIVPAHENRPAFQEVFFLIRVE